MLDVFESPIAQAMLWLGVLALVVGVAIFALRRLRERIDKEESQTSEMLSNFRDLHGRGGLSDAEFRTIKTALGAKLKDTSHDHPEKL